MTRGRASLTLLGAALGAALAASAAQSAEALVRLPAPGVPSGLVTLICTPEGPGPWPLALVNHGAMGPEAARLALAPEPCDGEAVRWFTTRGHLVAQPLRRGYGATGGAWQEGSGPCEEADHARAGRATAQDIAAALAALRARADVRPEGTVIVGHSAGGWGALALGDAVPPGVALVVNMAAGRGGRPRPPSGEGCRWDRLVEAARGFGAALRVPSLWIYAENDALFGPALARRLFGAFTGAGGRATLHLLPPSVEDGHGLFFAPGGSRTWGPLLAPLLPR